MSERNASIGYAALKVQSSPFVPAKPDVFVPYYKQSLNTDIHMMELNPIYGNKFKGYLLLEGQRSHGGSITVMAEPNTAARWFDMLLTKGTSSGTDPATHPFTLSNLVDPKFYTLDISLGSQVVRYIGVGASKITPTWNDDEMQFEIDLSALGSYFGREIASVAANALTLQDTNGRYNGKPSLGLVVGDLVRVVKANGTVIDTTIASLTDTEVTVAAAGTAAAGDMLVLRPATSSLSTKTPFLWPRTEFRFADDAATALTAPQTRLEQGSDVAIMHMFEDDEGAPRSGGFDPAALVRTVGDYEFKMKKFFDTPEEVKNWNASKKRACVMRSFSENGYEFRLTMNGLKTTTLEIPTEAEGVIYHEIEFGTEFSQSEGQGFDVVIINGVETI